MVTICGALRERGCELLLCDDAHHATDDTVSLLRVLSESVPVAIIAAGVDLVRTAFRLWTPDALPARRYTLITAQDFGYTTPEERLAWFSLIAAAERSLRLQHTNLDA